MPNRGLARCRPDRVIQWTTTAFVRKARACKQAPGKLPDQMSDLMFFENSSCWPARVWKAVLSTLGAGYEKLFDFGVV